MAGFVGHGLYPEALVGCQGLRLTRTSATRPSLIRALHHPDFQAVACTSRGGRSASIDAPGIHVEPSRPTRRGIDQVPALDGRGGTVLSPSGSLCARLALQHDP